MATRHCLTSIVTFDLVRTGCQEMYCCVKEIYCCGVLWTYFVLVLHHWKKRKQRVRVKFASNLSNWAHKLWTCFGKFKTMKKWVVHNVSSSTDASWWKNIHWKRRMIWKLLCTLFEVAKVLQRWKNIPLKHR